MCGRYAITTPLDAMQRLFAFQGQLINMPARYNVAPTQNIPIVRLENGARKFAMVRWGLVPPWANEMPKEKPLINARSETIAEKPSFRAAYQSKRCLVIADGFYEWQRSGAKPLPYYISRANGEMFAMAGIWESWISPNGEPIESAAIVTISANEMMSEIHHRMPVVIGPDSFDIWLSTGGDGTNEADRLLTPSQDDFFSMIPVSTAVNKVANDGPELVEKKDHTVEHGRDKEQKSQLSLF